MKQYVVAETLPGADVQTDDELLDYARQYGSTVFHATCSCKMGRDPLAVVDDQLRVHGIDGLRVIDASVMPAVTSTNTNAPTIMIAEKGAAAIRADARQRLARLRRKGDHCEGAARRTNPGRGRRGRRGLRAPPSARIRYMRICSMSFISDAPNRSVRHRRCHDGTRQQKYCQ